MKNKNKKIIIIIISIIIILAGGLGILLLRDINSQNNKSNNNYSTEINNEYINEINEYNFNYSLNNEYIGKIQFESGLISLPFVKPNIITTPEVAYNKYLRSKWDTLEYDEEGSIFMDPYNKLNDQNLILYGHYVYPEYDSSGTHKFTPLHQLKEESKYNNNKYIQLILKDEIRRYEISNVYYAKTDMDSDQPLEKGMEYMFSNFNDDALEYYMKRVNEEEFYDTGVEIGPDDKFLTLQTCVENRDDLKLIVIAKEIEVIKIR